MQPVSPVRKPIQDGSLDPGAPPNVASAKAPLRYEAAQQAQPASEGWTKHR